MNKRDTDKIKKSVRTSSACGLTRAPVLPIGVDINASVVLGIVFWSFRARVYDCWLG